MRDGMMAALPSGILGKMKFVNARNLTAGNLMACDCLRGCVLEMLAGLCVRVCARVWPIRSRHHLLCLVHRGGLLGFRAPGFQPWVGQQLPAWPFSLEAGEGRPWGAGVSTGQW